MPLILGLAEGCPLCGHRDPNPTAYSTYTLRNVLGNFAVYLTDDAVAKLYIREIKFSQIEGNGGHFSHTELTNM